MNADAPSKTLLILASTYPRWIGDHEPGFVHELARRMTARFRVIVLGPQAPGAKRQEVLDGVEVIRYRYAPQRLQTLVNDGGIVTNLKLHRWKLLLVPSFVLAQMWWAWRLCRQERVDVIHAHWLLPQGLIAALLRFLPGSRAPFVVTSHGADLFALRGSVLQTLKRWVLGRAQRATVVSEAMRDEVLSMGVPLSKVSVLPMGVDMKCRFVPSDLDSRVDNELLFVGRLVEKKGLRHLLDALPTVLKVRPDVKLTVAGFGPEQGHLKAQAQRLGVAHRVNFLGAVPQTELPALYRRASVMVAPFVRADSGDQEGLGLVLVEAVGCGCPLVVGDVPAVHDVVGDDAEAAVVEPGNRQQLAERILEILANPQAALAKVSRMRDVLEERFDWGQVASRYASVLDDASTDAQHHHL